MPSNSENLARKSSSNLSESLSGSGLLNLPELRKALARKRLLEFIKYTDNSFQVSWHHELMCQKLHDFLDRKIPNLAIFCPPRHSKSQLVSRALPAYALGRNPDATIISTSYSSDLAVSMARDVQRIMMTPAYAELFPETRLGSGAIGSAVRTQDLFGIEGHKGYLRSAGVGGSITGMGYEIGIIDDPVKNRQDAVSKKIMNTTYEWYQSTFATRRAPGAGTLLCQTRWGTSDLAGRLLQQMQDDSRSDRWEVITLPAIAEAPVAPYDKRLPGEALWNSRYPAEELLRIKSTVGSVEWNCLYQCNPTSTENSVIKREWIAHYTASPLEIAETADLIILSADLAFKESASSDYNAVVVIAAKGGNRYILDLYHEKADFSHVLAAARQMRAKWNKASAFVIEEAANGSALISTLRKEFPGVIGVKPAGGKAVRLASVSPQFESGNVLFPLPSHAPWVADAIDELVSFPASLNDDICDSIAHGLTYLAKKVSSLNSQSLLAPVVNERPSPYRLQTSLLGGSGLWDIVDHERTHVTPSKRFFG